MKQICVFLGFLVLMSCEYFNVKKTSSDAILEEELQTFNWNEVDEYPTFTTCDSMLTKAEKKQCFESTLTTHIFSHLNKENFIVPEALQDTLKMRLQISEHGVLDVLKLENSISVKRYIPNIDSLLIASLDSLPKILPAIKRGQFVKTEFELPIIIQVY